MRLRVGLIGLGRTWEKRHGPALRALSDRFEVRAVCEEVAVRAEMAAQAFSASRVDGFRALAQREDVDAVLILSPQWYGPLPIFAASDAGKAVYCAAAMDLSLEQLAELKRRVAEAGIAFMAEFARRHSPATLRLKELIATRLGPPKLLFCHRRMVISEKPNGYAWQTWHTPPVQRELTELIDWCRYVIGQEPTSVVGLAHTGDPAGSTGQDYQMMSLDFSAGQRGLGPIAQISCGRYMPEAWREAVSFRTPAGLQVCCEHGIAFVDLPSTLVWFDEAGRHQESLQSERPVGEQLLSQFHRAVTSLLLKSSDLEDAYRAMNICLLAQESYRTGQRQDLES